MRQEKGCTGEEDRGSLPGGALQAKDDAGDDAGQSLGQDDLADGLPRVPPSEMLTVRKAAERPAGLPRRR